MGELLTLFLSTVLINNIILSQFLGMCPFMGVSKNRSSALGMGFAVLFVIVGSSIITYLTLANFSLNFGATRSIANVSGVVIRIWGGFLSIF